MIEFSIYFSLFINGYAAKSKTVLNHFSVWFLGKWQNLIDHKRKGHYPPLLLKNLYPKSRALGPNADQKLWTVKRRLAGMYFFKAETYF